MTPRPTPRPGPAYARHPRPISRRRVLVGGLSLAASAALAAACSREPPPSSLGPPPGGDELKDTTNVAKTGGIFRLPQTQDPTSLDPHLSASFTSQEFAAAVYSRLLKWQTGPGIVPLSSVTGDAASSFEVADSGQTWTFRLRPDMRFHAKGPDSVRGRPLDADDVLASYLYFLDKNAGRKILQDLVDKLETPDKATVVFRLKEPYAPFHELAASSALFWLLSKQAVTREVDTQTPEGVVGTGPWFIESMRPGASIEMRRHGAWYASARVARGEVGLPLLDGYTLLNLPAYPQQHAAFVQGDIMGFEVSNPDLADTLRQRPDAQRVAMNPSWLLSMFFFNLDNPQNPFRDERLRRALSMSLNRDAIIEVFGEASKLRREGFTVPSGWNNSPIPWGEGGLFWWLDPRSREMGSAGRWYQYDVAEAVKLLSAAGYAGERFDINTTTQIYGAGFDLQTEAQLPMLSAAGLRYNLKATDYRGHYFPEVYTKGDYPHVGYGYNTPYNTVDEYLYNLLLPEGAQNHSKVNDPEIAALVRRQRTEADTARRRATVWQIQKLVSDKMYYVPSVVGRWGSYTLYAPYVRNAGAFRTARFAQATESYPYYWLDRA